MNALLDPLVAAGDDIEEELRALRITRVVLAEFSGEQSVVLLDVIGRVLAHADTLPDALAQARSRRAKRAGAP